MTVFGWFILGYIAIGILFASMIFRLSLIAARRGRFERNTAGEVISFIIEVAFWPVFLFLKIFFEKRKSNRR